MRGKNTKKKIALILAACLMLSACTGNAEQNHGGNAVPNQGTNGNANSTGSSIDSAESNVDGYKDGIGFEKEDVVTKPSQPAVPAVDVIRVNKLEYEYGRGGL